MAPTGVGDGADWMQVGRAAWITAAALGVVTVGALAAGTRMSRDMRGDDPQEPGSPLGRLAYDVQQGARLIGQVVTSAAGFAGHWIAHRGDQQSSLPLPTMGDLAQRFPEAGIPQRIVGTSIDPYTFGSTDADAVMAEAAGMGFNTVRISADWSQLQPDPGRGPDFTRLDAVLAAADRHGLRVVLTVGAKAMAWPEYHVPRWALPARDAQDVSADPEFRARSLSFVRSVASHYADDAAVMMWQVENEPLDGSGPKLQYMEEGALADEAAALHAADGGRRPVLVNGWSASDRTANLEADFRVGDAVALDVYPAAGYLPFGIDATGRADTVPREVLDMARRTGKPAMIGELQADDWLPYRTSATDVRTLATNLTDMGYRDILFWRMSSVLDREREGDTSLRDTESDLAHQWLG